MNKFYKLINPLIIGFYFSLIVTLMVKFTSIATLTGIFATVLLIANFILNRKNTINNLVSFLVKTAIIAVSSIIIWASGDFKEFIVNNESSNFPLIALICSFVYGICQYFCPVGIVGIKTPSLCNDKDLWYKVHEFGSKSILATSLPIYLLIYYFDKNTKQTSVVLMLAISIIIFILYACIVVSKYDKNLDQQEFKFKKQQIQSEEKFHF